MSRADALVALAAKPGGTALQLCAPTVGVLRDVPAAGRLLGSGAALPEGCHAVVCPANGVFYRRPRPADPPYVDVGSAVRTGQTLGLIEAMKTFSPIPYGGPGLPSEASVVEIRADDSQEVRHGQVLFVLR